MASDSANTSPLTPAQSAYQRRVKLNNEWHARPVAQLQTPLRCSHQVFLRRGEASASEGLMADFCHSLGQPGPSKNSRYHLAQLGSTLVKWEAHTEADSVTCLVPGSGHPLFGETAAQLAPSELLSMFGDDLVCGVHFEVMQQPWESVDPEQIRGALGSDAIYCSWIGQSKASLWSSFRLDKDGFTRLVLIDHGLPDHAAGRVLQRLLEIETYRLLMMIALPYARETMGKINSIEARLSPLTEQLAKDSGPVDHQALLIELSQMAAEVEHLATTHSYRFAAARAYYQIVEQRVEELREEKIPGQPRYSTFLFKTLQPAKRTCDAADRRIEELAERIARATQLLNSIVAMRQAQQSHQMMESTNRNTETQIGLQKAVEGFSIFVISYYALGLLNYVLTAAYASGLPIEPKAVTGWSAPLVLIGVWMSTRWVRKRFESED